jgi:hypothetical protein
MAKTKISKVTRTAYKKTAQNKRGLIQREPNEALAGLTEDAAI